MVKVMQNFDNIGKKVAAMRSGGAKAAKKATVDAAGRSKTAGLKKPMQKLSVDGKKLAPKKPLPTGKKTAVDLKKTTADRNKALKDAMK